MCWGIKLARYCFAACPRSALLSGAVRFREQKTETVQQRLRSSGPCVKQIQKLKLFFRGEEGCLEGVTRQFAQVLVGKGERILSQLVFPGEGRTKHRWIVSVERDHHPVVKVVADRVFGQGLTAAGAQIAGEANLHRNLAGRQLFHQFKILPGSQPMANPLCPKIQCAPDGFGSGGAFCSSPPMQKPTTLGPLCRTACSATRWASIGPN